MVSTLVKKEERAKKTQTKNITVFHCFNTVGDLEFLDDKEYSIQAIQMPCSSISREIFLLKAFESGADAVVVLVCPVGACRHIDGNIRAEKRVNRMKKLLDEIGMNGRRLNIYNVAHDDESTVNEIIEETLDTINELGPLPTY